MSHDPEPLSGHDSDSLSQSSFEYPDHHTLCIIGLGNPGEEYRHTRHNVGFWLVDAIARELGLKFRRRLFSPYSVAAVDTRVLLQRLEKSGTLSAGEAPRYSRLVLVKPHTYMNNSGRVLPHILRSYERPIQFAVAVDQLDLPAGSLRIKKRGGTAGHNGLKSIVSYLDRDFWPLYIGIGRPGDKSQVITHVLGIPPEDEERILRDSVERLASYILGISRSGLETWIQEINSDNVREPADVPGAAGRADA